jgi:proline iminopeptidase
VAQIVYVDHRGHGRSDPCPSDEWTLDTFADDVVRLCEALGIVKPIVLGQSFGGFVAQRYLARHPQHPAKVILSSTSPHLGLERKLAVFERLGGAAARDAAEAFWRAPNAANWAVYSQHCRHLYNTTPQAPEVSARTIFNTEILFTSAAACPVMVLVGTEDPVCPLADSQDIAAALPPQHAQLQVVDGAGHGVWRDKPDVGMALLRRFILA